MTQQKTGVWIDWEGGECPVPHDTKVMVKLRVDDDEFQSKSYNAGRLCWIHAFDNSNIIAYMIVPTYVPPAKLERWKIVKRTQPVGYGCTFEYLTHYAINDATSTKLGNLVATTDGEYALLTRFAKLLNEVAP